MKLQLKGSPVLRKKSKRVSKINDEVRQFCLDLGLFMRSEGGIGISAPQGGYNKRIIVVDKFGKDWVLINPEIIWDDGTSTEFKEGCLSIPGFFAEVYRPDKIKVKYRDINGKPQVDEVDGIFSRVIQHEIDHLNGVLFTDYLTDEGSSITI